MKCENCGKNEVSFVYQSNINGKVTEKHLCSECAQKLGYSQQVLAHQQRMMQNFFGNDGFFGGGLLNDFFSPRLLGGVQDFFEDPFDDFFHDMPALRAAPAQERPAEEQSEKKDHLVGQEEQSRFAKMRQLNALRMEMKKAVHQENFERAAELRDQIHQLEAQDKKSE